MDDPVKCWDRAREALRGSMDPATFSRWIEPLAARAAEDGSLRLGVGDDFAKIWLENNFGTQVEAALAAAAPGLRFAFTLDASLAPAADDAAAAAPSAPKPAPRAKGAPGEMRGVPLNPDFTFENFITGPSNSFAQAAALQVAANPGGSYNPLLVIGATGLGKTHLMQAVAHAVHKRDARATIVYITLEAMLNDLIDAIKNGTNADFRRRYRHTDLLLVDDIQFISRSPQLQEEFFNTFNALQNERKQIVLTCDRPPNKIQGLDERLVSRFQQGLVTDIQSPEYATRMAILKSKQAGAAEPLPDEFLAYIAENITSNVRQLEGALTKLVCYRNLLGKPLTREIVEDQLRGILDQEKRAEPSCQDIQRVVAEEFDLRLADMTSKERPQNVAMPRQIAMFLCRSFTNKSLPEIAKAFDKTHATVVHACKTVPGRMETDRTIRAHVENICDKLGRDPAQL